MGRLLWAVAVLGIAGLLAVAPAIPLASADIIGDTEQARREQRLSMNGNRVGIVTGGTGGTYIKMAGDLGDLIESLRPDMRIVVMRGRGSVRNLQELAFLEYTDLALVQADVLDSIAREDSDDYEYLNKRVAYVARFHPEILHVLVRDGPLDDPRRLDGRRIAIGLKGSGTQITAPNVFEIQLGIKPQFVDMRPEDALADLLSDAPTIDGLAYVVGRGAPLFKSISPEIARKIRDKRLYFVPFAAEPPAQTSYIKAELKNADYASFIAQGQTVPVWTVPAVLAVYDWNPSGDARQKDRHRRVSDFIEIFFGNRAKLGKGGDANWCSVDLAARVGGWKRFSAAQAWLDAHPGADMRVCEAGPPSCQELFSTEMRKAGFDPADAAVQALFTSWRAQRGSACQ